MDTKLGIAVSGFIGAFLLVGSDIGLKGHASAIKTIRDNMAHFFNVPSDFFLAVVTMVGVLVVGVACCFIFEEKSMKQAFYRGASVLAIGMTLTPNPQHPPAQTSQNSERVELQLETADKRPIPLATLTVWDIQTNRIVAMSRFSKETFAFYQNAGKYKIYVEVPGYNIETREVEVVDGRAVAALKIRFVRARIPLPIQRIFK